MQYAVKLKIKDRKGFLAVEYIYKLSSVWSRDFDPYIKEKAKNKFVINIVK
jgi:hypothetical protein